MSIFKEKLKGAQHDGKVPKNPVDLFENFLTKNEGGPKHLWAHQNEILHSYHDKFLDILDVGLELSTGSGKTLMAGLIADFRRRTKRQRVLYLCPTKQLAKQVHSQLNLYEIPSGLFIGKQKDYDQVAFSRYQRAEQIAISTYTALFNSNPRFDTPETLIFDDAHVGDSALSNFWSLTIDKSNDPEAFDALHRVLEDYVSEPLNNKIRNSDFETNTKVELIPTQLWFQRSADVLNLLQTDFENRSDHFTFTRSKIVSNLCNYNLFCSDRRFEFSPVSALSLSFQPFSNAQQRIFVSATFGRPGELEKIYGVKKIQRIPQPEDWRNKNFGRRLILIPELLQDVTKVDFLRKIVAQNTRAICVVANWGEDKKAREVFDGFRILSASDIEDSKTPFTQSKEPTVLVLANRYEGMDFPDEECRVTILCGVAQATNLQEEFLSSRLGLDYSLSDLVRSRLVQAAGRCTRSNADYAILLVADPDLLQWMNTISFLDSLPSSLRAEVTLGVQVSEGSSISDFEKMASEFLSKKGRLEEVETALKEIGSGFSVPMNTTEHIEESSYLEVEYAYLLNRKDFRAAVTLCETFLNKLSGEDHYRPSLRAFWNYLAARASFLEFFENKNTGVVPKHNEFMQRAVKSTHFSRWVNPVTLEAESGKLEFGRSGIGGGASRALDAIKKIGSGSSRKVNDRLNEILKGLQSQDADPFERALYDFGALLGAYVWRDKKAQSSPDVVWKFDADLSLIFEAKNEYKSDHPIDATNVRQGNSHQNWLNEHHPLLLSKENLTVMVTKQTSVDGTAKGVIDNLFHGPIENLCKYFDEYSNAVRTWHSTYGTAPVNVQIEAVTSELLNKFVTKERLLKELGIKHLKEL